LGVENSNPDARRPYERLGYRSVSRTDFLHEGCTSSEPRRAHAEGDRMSITAEQAWAALHEVEDPEIPVVSLADLGVVRDVRLDGHAARQPSRLDAVPHDPLLRVLQPAVREVQDRLKSGRYEAVLASDGEKLLVPPRQ